MPNMSNDDERKSGKIKLNSTREGKISILIETERESEEKRRTSTARQEINIMKTREDNRVVNVNNNNEKKLCRGDIIGTWRLTGLIAILNGFEIYIARKKRRKKQTYEVSKIVPFDGSPFNERHIMESDSSLQKSGQS